jgi:hypothetical protein
VTLYGSEKRKAADGLSKTSPFKTIDSWNYGTHYINGYDSLLIDSKNESDILDSFGISNIAIDGLDQALLTQYVEKVLKTREDGKEFVTESLDVFNGTLGLFNPDAYLYPYVDKMYDTPVTSSDLLVASTSVPFLQLVLGNHVEMYSRELNFINNEDITLLKLIEHGVSPSYTLTLDETFELEYTNFYEVYISEYDAMRRRMMSYNDFIKEGLLISQNNEMVDHRYVMENVVLSTFSNGKQILINYNNYQIEYDGIKVNALDYEVN